MDKMNTFIATLGIHFYMMDGKKKIKKNYHFTLLVLEY